MYFRNLIASFCLALLPAWANALELGLEAQATVNVSDNIGGANAGFETEGQLLYTQFGVFGEQRGQSITGAFDGQLIAERRLDDSESEFSSISQFLGAVNWQITPRSFSWYAGDILGGVRANDGLQPIDSLQNERRNVFVTGPRFEYEVGQSSRIDARILYVNQSQTDVELESLLTTSASYEFDTDGGNTFGILLNNVFTDNPEVDTPFVAGADGDLAIDEGDFNRLTIAGTWTRNRGRFSYDAQLGATRFDTDLESVDGANIQLALSRQLGPQTTTSFQFSRALLDQNLTTVESLITEGTGLRPEGDGIFDETRVRVAYDFTSTVTNFEVFAGAGQADFRLLADVGEAVRDATAEDFRIVFAGGSYQRRFGPRFRANMALSYEQRDLLNRDDNTQSILGSAQFIYRLSRSFEAELTFRSTVSEGVDTITAAQNGLPAILEDLDTTENRVVLGIRWAPPTRATRELTVALSSLLQ